MNNTYTDRYTNQYTDRFAALAMSDRRLLALMSAASLVILVLGIMGGLMTALARGGFIDILNTTGYRWLTLHGVSIFFYWLFIAQAALLLGFAAIERGRGLVLKALAWLGFVSILVGFGLSMVGIQQGMPLLYDGAPELARHAPRDLLVFNLGYLLLGLGLMILPLSAIATLIEPRRAGRQERLSAVGFALFTWAGFLIVSGFAAIYTFLPGTLWALGLGDFPVNHGTNWHIVFHNMHYLPLMATVILWYVLIHALTGVKSVFGERFSKIVFALYLVFVPPTSLYHMFLEPDLPEIVRVVGSLLSLFVSVPTLTAFLIIVASLEVYARSQGGRGLFGWIRFLPWLAFVGLLLFGGAGVAAGYLGVPRRVMDMAYQGQVPEMWQILMATVAIGGSIMALALIIFAVGVAVSLLPRRQPLSEQAGLTVDWGRQKVIPGLRAVTGPLSVLVIVLAMYLFTVIGFEMMQALPIAASGGGGH